MQSVSKKDIQIGYQNVSKEFLLAYNVYCSEFNQFACNLLGILNLGPYLVEGSFLDSFALKIFSIQMYSWDKQEIYFGEIVNNDCTWVESFFKEKDDRSKDLFWTFFADDI